MTALLSMLAAKATPYIIGAGAILAAFIATYVKGRLSGAALERNAQKAKEADARDIADQVDNDIGALPGSKARRNWVSSPSSPPIAPSHGLGAACRLPDAFRFVLHCRQLDQAICINHHSHDGRGSSRRAGA